LVLASASPRRRELLRRLQVAVEVRPAAVDETPRPGESAGELVVRLAEAKVRAVATDADAVVVGADTVVSLDGAVFGKPLDADDAARMLRALSGRTHEVVTGMAVWRGPARPLSVEVVTSRVTFVELSEADVVWYLATGEPFDKAGAYGHQGAAGRFVASIEGSQTSVTGLPLATLARLLAS
jgi:septum formation protein